MSLITIAGPGLALTLGYTNERLSLCQVQRRDGAPLLYRDQGGKQVGPGPVGNPLTVVIREGEYAGIYEMNSFRVLRITHDERHLLAYLQHEAMPLGISLEVEVEVEGHVATWRGQAAWNGEVALEADIYFPLFSRVRFAGAGKGRALVPEVSGVVLEPLSEANYRRSYLGNLSCPVFLAEGGQTGLALLDDNRADYAADPGACVLRSVVIGNSFPLPKDCFSTAQADPAGREDGLFIGIAHTRYFHPRQAGVTAAEEAAGRDETVPPAMIALGDAADLGPVRTYAYSGSWRVGADWLRRQRRHLPFRVSPARWYQRTTFVAEDMGDEMVRRGESFYSYPEVLADKERLGSDFFHIPGFHDPEILGTSSNWLNRGDYFFAAQNLGGFEAVRQGVEALHRRGGRILYYVEGLIMWKRSRIGRSSGQEWAIMNADGSYLEHYKGFWHMCPACEGWRRWIAQTCAEILRSTGIDGFFVDSLCVAGNHRCFNPAHRHPQPIVWNWGVRQLLREIRQAIDQVNPEAVILAEGEGDVAREFVDGFLSHTHYWGRMLLTEPFVRFLHPEMRAYESWSWFDREPAQPERQIELQLWNSVTGHRIYSHNPDRDKMAPFSSHTRRYYDAFPEICDSQMSMLTVETENCIAELFEGPPHVVTVGNPSAQPTEARVRIPVPTGMLFDRVDGTRVPVMDGEAKFSLGAWTFRAFELRP